MSWGTRERSRTCRDLLQTQHTASKEVDVRVGQEAAALPPVSGLALFASTRITRNGAKTPSFKDDLLPESSKCVLPQKALLA